MNILVAIGMYILPAVFAVIIHSYLRHGDISRRRRAVFLLVYFVIINAITYGTSLLRGVGTLDVNNMTFSYKMKYAGMGMVLAFIIPFPICLFTEEIITIGGFRRYIFRFLRDVRKYLPYAVSSARADLRAEVAGSYLNWAWWLIEPVCTMLIYTLIFGVVFNAKEQYFPVFIFIGITMWGFFTRNVSGSVDIVRANKGIITKVYIPKYILFLSKMFVNGFKMLISFGVVILMMLVYRVEVTRLVLLSFPILATLFLFTFGVGSIMMHYGVYVNDLGYITNIVLMMLMYLTGTFYNLNKRMPEPFGEILETWNPVAFMLASMRKVLLYGEMFDISTLLIWVFVSLVMIALGAFTIYSNENAYVKMI